MEKKEYHGFDVEEEDLTGIDEIITASSACISQTFNSHSWADAEGAPYEIIKESLMICANDWDSDPLTIVYQG